MCGIVGVIASDKSMRIAVDALKRLEYRGYDSFGISVIDQDNILTKKSVGSISEQDDNGFFNEITDTCITIGHTRWATHGAVSQANAHPHYSYNNHFSLVHNGVIENYSTIRQQLATQNIHCQSDTDTEVIVHLLAQHYEKTQDILESIRLTIAELDGEYAFTFITKYAPNQLFAARYKSPLAVAKTENLTIIASDQTAIAPLTTEMIFLKEGDVIAVSLNEIQCYNLADNQLIPVERQTTSVPWTGDNLGKQGYPHYMLKEMYESPQAIENALKLSETAFSPILNEVLEHQLNIVGAGSGLYSANLGQYYFSALAGTYARVHASDEFLNLVQFTPNDHLIALSQSGETFDTLEVIYEALKQKTPVTGINNVFGSTCHRIVDYSIFQGAGAEVCVLSTKSVISQDIILYLLAAHFGHKNGTLSTETFNTLIEDARKLPALILHILNNYQARIQDIVFSHKHIYNWFFIGREMYYAVALESALKYKEVSYIHAEAMSGGLFKHGTISLIDEEFHTIAFLPQQKTSPHIFNFTLSNIAEIQARNGKVIAFCHEEDADKVSAINETILLPSLNRYLDPILQLVAGQILAYYCGIALERDIDKPRSLAKSVTVR